MSDLIQLRKITMQFEEIYHEGGPPPAKPLVRAAILAVVRNPYAGHYVQDLLPLAHALRPLGVELARRLIDALGGAPDMIEGCGEGAIVGAAGELEHGALWHQPGRQGMREALGRRSAGPSANKVGPIGTRLDIPVTSVDGSYAASHCDTIETGVADAPRPDEMVVILAMTTGARIHARTSGVVP